MRTGLILIFALMAAPVMGANLQGVVFGYECEQIDPKETGFTCKLGGTNAATMEIHFIKNLDKAPKEERRYKNYRFYNLLVRYFDLGGKYFTITYEWEPSLTKDCSKTKGKIYSYNCSTD